MKKINILFGIPCPDVVYPEFAIDNLHALVAYTRKLDFVGDVFLTYQKGVRTDKNRNLIVERALEQGSIDYIVWLDADMLFPHDMVKRYFELESPDIIGCLYFKRGDTFDPIVYTKNPNREFSYKIVNPTMFEPDAIVEVDGLGFGGMMVSMDLYRKMGEDKWCVYGEDFHIPYRTGNQLTHDINFCRLAKDKYEAKIFCHLGVRPGHIGDKVVTINDWIDYNKGKIGKIREKNINTREYWDKKYTEKPEEYTNIHEKQTVRWKKALQFIEDGEDVLDAGCGIGSFLEYVKSVKEVNGHGVDISSYAVELCKKKLPEYEFEVMDLAVVKDIKKSYDVIFAGETIEHLDNPEAFFDICAKALKKGGRLIITTPNINAIDSEEHVQSYSKDRLVELAEKVGLSPVVIETLFDGKIIFFVASHS